MAPTAAPAMTSNKKPAVCGVAAIAGTKVHSDFGGASGAFISGLGTHPFGFIMLCIMRERERERERERDLYLNSEFLSILQLFYKKAK